jgi:4'-phosphopantetheinyl transferase EntD
MPLIRAYPHRAELQAPAPRSENDFLLLWRIDESVEELERLVTAADRESASRYAGERRRQHLAWRAALRTVLPGAEVRYGDTGAPEVEGVYISVSHTRGLAAVRISDRPCGVDAERADRDMSAVRGRVVSGEEELLADAGREEFAVSVWCAKEVMYKMSGRRGLDFLRDLKVGSCDLARGTVAGLHMIKIYPWIVVFL